MNDSAADAEVTTRDIFAGAGALGDLVRAFDWASTPLGPIRSWPRSLLTAVGIVLHSPVPIVMLWGQDGIMIYNDAYSIFAGNRHPRLLGSKVREGWPEVADFNDNVMKVGLAGGTLAYRDQELTLHRTGRPERVWMNLDYSPILDESGSPAGVIAIVIETTARVLAERARDAAEARATGVLEGMAESFLLLDNAFSVIAINAEGLRYERRASDELVGRPLWEIWKGAEDSEVGALCRRAMDEHVAAATELRASWSGERAPWIELRAYPSGSGLALFYRDVTERRRAEDCKTALVTLGDRLRDLKQPEQIAEIAGTLIGETLGVAQAAYAIIAPDGDRAMVLKPWLRDGSVISLGGPQRFSDYGSYGSRLHLGKAIVVNDTCESPLTAEQREVFERQKIAAFVNMPLLEGERMAAMVLAFDDRARAWSEDELAFLRSVADRTWAALKTAEAEAALLDLNRDLERQVEVRTGERNLFATIVESTDALIMVFDQNYNILAINKANADAFDRIYGFRPRVGDNFLGLLKDNPAEFEAVRSSWSRAIAGEEFTFVGAYGDPRRERPYFEIRFNTLRDERGKQIGAFQIVQDVTEILRDQKKLAETQEALRQSQKMEAVGQLTGGLAHDFNNLLTGISGSLELLQMRIAQGRVNEVDRYVAAAQGAARRAAALTHRLLAFSRRQTLDPRATSVPQLIAGMQDLIERAIGPAVELDISVENSVWPALVDPNQLENALLNLCINARDAMPDGGTIKIAVTNTSLDRQKSEELDLPGGDYLTLCVTDNGTGMTQNVIERAFDPFFTTKPLGEGTGLGLSMIYGFVRQSGGQIRIDSTVGCGTTMCLYLPRHDGPEELADTTEESVPVTRAQEGETVLVVDDEAAVRMLVIEVLRELGYNAVEAEDGASAFKILQSGMRIDLLVTDVGLPGGINGRQVADAARSFRPDMKVLFITGYAETAALGEGSLHAGMEVLTKPFAVETLMSRIKGLIGK